MDSGDLDRCSVTLGVVRTGGIGMRLIDSGVRLMDSGVRLIGSGACLIGSGVRLIGSGVRWIGSGVRLIGSGVLLIGSGEMGSNSGCQYLDCCCDLGSESDRTGCVSRTRDEGLNFPEPIR